MTPSELVALISTTTPDLSARLQELSSDWSSTGKDITGKCYYVTLRDSKITLDDLIAVAHARIINFAIPPQRINEVVNSHPPGSGDPWVILTTEARDLFMQTKDHTGRSGEFGEILLYMLVEWALNAPIVACKMYLKTSKQMPVHGADGIHLGSSGANLVMYWNESKLHASISGGIADLIATVADRQRDTNTRENEIRVVRANLNVSMLPAAATEALKNYFNPWRAESNNVVDRFACLVAFDATYYDDVKALPQLEAVTSLETAYALRIDSARQLIAQGVADAGLENFGFDFFLLPLPSVEETRRAFQKKLWGN